ncbi:MAG: protein translocase subunit SecD [Acetivibrionales bacterium]|jgi:preprotein translocase subunit SecD
MKGSNGLKFFLVILVIGILTYLAAYGFPALKISSLRDIRYGIDIRGGVGATLYPGLPEGTKPTSKQLETARTVIEKRLNSKGIFDYYITTEEENGRIILEIPYKQGETDLNPQKTIDEIGKTALLTFQEVDEDKFDGYNEFGSKNYLPTGRIVIEGNDVKDAGVETNPQTGQVVVTLELNSQGADKFSEATGRLVGQKIAIFMDEELITAPVVNERIPGGNAVISGQRDAKEAGELAATIRSGALPFSLEAKEINSITPLLGAGALRVTINAAIVAFILVFLFMLINYRLPGLIADIALFGLVVLELVVITWLGITLTLPGIAGIILSIGMGVDANVIIFERIKEELRSGKTLRTSIDLGFKRAFTAILDSNVTTVISAAVLYIMGTGPIKGFAATLFIGVILSFLTAVVATRIMMKAVSDLDIAKFKWLYGYKEV